MREKKKEAKRALSSSHLLRVPSQFPVQIEGKPPLPLQLAQSSRHSLVRGRLRCAQTQSFFSFLVSAPGSRADSVIYLHLRSH